MKIKNKDGTINSLPICVIFTVFAIAIHILVFGIDFKESSVPFIGDIITTQKANVETTTIKVCNGCSMRFTAESVDVSTNGEVDIAEFMNLNKVNMRNVSFSSSDTNLFSVLPSGNSFKVSTGNLEGSALLNAKYADMDLNIVVNVIHPSRAEVKYKYDYYFVGLKNKISPEIVTYPYGYNTSGMTFSAAGKNIISATKNKNVVSGRKVGEDIVTLEVGNIKASTKIYVVPNLITIKTNESGSYKEARNITPQGTSFDFVVQFEDKSKENFDNKNITISFDRNDLNANVKYVKKHSDINSYIYHMEFSGSGTSIMRVELSDGSFTLFEIYK